MNVEIHHILVLKGHGFSRAAQSIRSRMGLQPLREGFGASKTSLSG
jgi:hypothetical protein